MVDIQWLADATGADVVTKEDDLQAALDVATALVDTALADTWRDVPEAVRETVLKRAAYAEYVLLTASDAGNVLGADGTVVPGVSNDPLRKSWPLIKRYVNRV